MQKKDLETHHGNIRIASVLHGSKLLLRIRGRGIDRAESCLKVVPHPSYMTMRHSRQEIHDRGILGLYALCIESPPIGKQQKMRLIRQNIVLGMQRLVQPLATRLASNALPSMMYHSNHTNGCCQRFHDFCFFYYFRGIDTFPSLQNCLQHTPPRICLIFERSGI